MEKIHCNDFGMFLREIKQKKKIKSMVNRRKKNNEEDKAGKWKKKLMKNTETKQDQ